MRAEKRCPSLGPWLLGAGCTRPGAYPLRPGPPEASAGDSLGLSAGLAPWAAHSSWRRAEVSARDRRSRASLLTPGVRDHRVAGGGDRSGPAGRQGSQCRPRTHLWSHVHTTRTPPTLGLEAHSHSHTWSQSESESLIAVQGRGAWDSHSTKTENSTITMMPAQSRSTCCRERHGSSSSRRSGSTFTRAM